MYVPIVLKRVERSRTVTRGNGNTFGMHGSCAACPRGHVADAYYINPVIA